MRDRLGTFRSGFQGLFELSGSPAEVLLQEITFALGKIRVLFLLAVEPRQGQDLVDHGLDLVELLPVIELRHFGQPQPHLVLGPQSGLVVRIEADDFLPPGRQLVDFVAELDVAIDQLVQYLGTFDALDYVQFLLAASRCSRRFPPTPPGA